MNKKMTYSLKCANGAYMFLRETNQEPFTHTFQLIGSVPPLTITTTDDAHEPYTGATAYNFPLYPDVESLAQEAVINFKLDPARVQRAAEIVRASRTNCQPARRDENGEPIQSPSYEVHAVKSQKDNAWYVVKRGYCSCHDSREDGNICKHRVAAWITRELAERPARIAQAQGTEWAKKERAVNMEAARNAAEVTK